MFYHKTNLENQDTLIIKALVMDSKMSTVAIFISQMQGAFLVADDIMDHSLTRRGKPCWYKQVLCNYISFDFYTLLPTVFLHAVSEVPRTLYTRQVPPFQISQRIAIMQYTV